MIAQKTNLLDLAGVAKGIVDVPTFRATLRELHERHAGAVDFFTKTGTKNDLLMTEIEFRLRAVLVLVGFSLSGRTGNGDLGSAAVTGLSHMIGDLLAGMDDEKLEETIKMIADRIRLQAHNLREAEARVEAEKATKQ